MNKFKVGDKVIRVSETYGKAIKGGVYEVSGVSDKSEWADSCGINLKGHEGVSGEIKYESSYFELYVEGALSPLEAAESLLNKDSLQIYRSDDNKWQEFLGELKNITLEYLKHIKLRHKSKTVIINGVEMVAPVDTKSLGYPDKVYGVNLSRKSVYDATRHTDRGLFWATEEDAQKALDAMLIPFEQ